MAEPIGPNIFVGSRVGFPRNDYIFCAKFALFSRKIFFCELLRMKRNEFCAVLRNFFCAICAKSEIFFCEFLRMKRKEFCAICAKPEVLRKLN